MEITLNSLEHFCFCKYQWWLLYTENEWLSNVHTTLGDIIHSRVDIPSFVEKRKNVLVKRSVPVYSDKLNLYGIADLVEYIKQDDKISKINVIEYKKGKPQENGSVQIYDGLQLYAQMYCLREIHNCEVRGFIYYAAIKRRVELKDETYFDNLLIKTLEEMCQYIKNKNIPPKNISHQCKSCSMYEICLPILEKRNA